MKFNLVSLVYKLVVVLFISTLLIPGQTSLAPVEDVFIYTFGGGQGANIFLKYNISSLPGDIVVDSAFLTPFVHFVGTNWDGDAKFFNVNSQIWTGADSSRLIYSIATSESTHQSTGFAIALGQARSVDLRNIVNIDYSGGHTFCSIKIKDPDDMTFQPPPGSYPVNSNETLAVGEILSNCYVFVYPSEYSNAPPWLVIYHHTVDLSENDDAANLSVNAHPNPFNQSITIQGCSPNGSRLSAVIYNAIGSKITL